MELNTEQELNSLDIGNELGSDTEPEGIEVTPTPDHPEKELMNIVKITNSKIGLEIYLGSSTEPFANLVNGAIYLKNDFTGTTKEKGGSYLG